MEGRGSKLDQMLPRPCSFILTAQASISGSASEPRSLEQILMLSSLVSLVCKLGGTPPPSWAVLEMEPHQETDTQQPCDNGHTLQNFSKPAR